MKLRRAGLWGLVLIALVLGRCDVPPSAKAQDTPESPRTESDAIIVNRNDLSPRERTIADLYETAALVESNYGIPRELPLTIWMHETGWDIERHRLTRECHNYGGVKYSGRGQFIKVRTWEEVEGKKKILYAKFQCYESRQDMAKAWAELVVYRANERGQIRREDWEKDFKNAVERGIFTWYATDSKYPGKFWRTYREVVTILEKLKTQSSDKGGPIQVQIALVPQYWVEAKRGEFVEEYEFNTKIVEAITYHLGEKFSVSRIDKTTNPTLDEYLDKIQELEKQGIEVIEVGGGGEFAVSDWQDLMGRTLRRYVGVSSAELDKIPQVKLGGDIVAVYGNLPTGRQADRVAGNAAVNIAAAIQEVYED